MSKEETEHCYKPGSSTGDEGSVSWYRCHWSAIGNMHTQVFTTSGGNNNDIPGAILSVENKQKIMMEQIQKWEELRKSKDKNEHKASIFTTN